MKILHIVPGLEDGANGMAVVARLIANEQGNARVIDLARVEKGDVASFDEIWVHGMWLPMEWQVCRWVLKAKKLLVRIPHGSLDPVRLHYHGWKKWLAGPIERYWFGKADRILATCKAEKGWIEKYLGKRCPEIEVMDLKRFFELRGSCSGLADNQKQETENQKLNLLCLGRRHPLKGVEYLEEAVAQLNSSIPPLPTPPLLKIVSNAFGEEKERAWDWCDILVLPTLSENFGLVVAEALERGKRVITTDGAPVWGEESGEVGER